MKIVLVLLALFAPTYAFAQSSSSTPVQTVTPQGGLLPTNTVTTCGPISGVLSAVGQVVQMPAACSGFGTYVITVAPVSGQAAFVGTIASYDAITGGPRRLHKTGVGALQVSSDVLSGSQSSVLEYRTCGGAGPQAVSASAYTSGQALVTIYGVLGTTACFVNGAVQTAAEAALRAGKSFTASTGFQTVTAGQFLSITLSNPANSGVRLIIPENNRILACNNPSNAALPSFGSRVNVATNVPATTATITRRGGTSGTSAATVTTANSANLPDTSPATTNPVGLPFFGSYSIPQDRTLEAGNTLTLTITAVGTGLTGANNPSCSIIVSWFEEATS